MQAPERYLVSPLLARAGFLHGFSARAGGVSRPPFDSLNLGAAVGDDPAAVRENLARLAAEAGVPAFDQASQVHGRRVLEVEARTAPERLRHEEADALISRAPGRVPAVRTADCVPLLMGDPETGAVAAVHAGWRGTLADIDAAALEALSRRWGVPPGRVRVAVGPSIRACCYEVGDEVAARFEAAMGPAVVRRRPGGRPRLDLVAAHRLLLERAGVDPAHLDVLDACTACTPERFYSHRRDGAASGRHLSFIAAPQERGIP